LTVRCIDAMKIDLRMKRWCQGDFNASYDEVQTGYCYDT